MTKKEILPSLKEIRDKSYELCLKKNVITKEEYEKLTDSLYKKISNLLEDIEKSVEK
jgi:Ni,Fe-hydrogenase maturation factor